ncbi:MAG: hypothetical protein ACRD1T_14825, partial [Acidimicrobiia bacterium]
MSRSEQVSTKQDRWFRWIRWTWPRLLLAWLWIGITTVAAFLIGLWIWLVDRDYGFASPSSPLLLPTLTVAMALVWMGGPLGVWAFRRTRPWLIMTALFGSLVFLSALAPNRQQAVVAAIDDIPIPNTWRLIDERVEGAGAP